MCHLFYFCFLVSARKLKGKTVRNPVFHCVQHKYWELDRQRRDGKLGGKLLPACARRSPASRDPLINSLVRQGLLILPACERPGVNVRRCVENENRIAAVWGESLIPDI